jgi:hypothetical protein
MRHAPENLDESGRDSVPEQQLETVLPPKGELRVGSGTGRSAFSRPPEAVRSSTADRSSCPGNNDDR